MKSRTTPLAVLALSLALLLTTACSWSVPADPGLNTRIRGGAAWTRTATGAAPASGGPSADLATAASDAGAQAIYLRKCGRCHEPFAPASLPASAWPGVVKRYGPRAGLFGAERQRVLAWLMANAR